MGSNPRMNIERAGQVFGDSDDAGYELQGVDAEQQQVMREKGEQEENMHGGNAEREAALRIYSFNKEVSN